MPTEIIQSVLRELRLAGTDDLFTHCALHDSELAALVAVLRASAAEAVLLVGADPGALVLTALHGVRVYAVGADPVRAAQLERRLPHVCFVPGAIGPATAAALAACAAEQRNLDVALVLNVGNGSDLGAVVSTVLSAPLRRTRTVLVHDSFAGTVRRALLALDWAAWKSVHECEIDFVAGTAAGGGLARVKQRPDAREGGLVFTARNQALFDRPATPAALAPGAAPDGFSLYRKFAELDEAAVLARLASSSSAVGDDPAFLAIRARLLPRLAAWKAQGRRVAVYGAGRHTHALLGLVPELHERIVVFLDRARTAPFLDRPCLAPAGFSPALADVIVYSSRAAETEMVAAMQSHAVEHVRLYTDAPGATATLAAGAGGDPTLGPKLAQAQAQISDLQLSVAALTQQIGRAPEPQDLHFGVVHQHLQLGVRYAVACAVPGEIAEFGTMAGRTASVIAQAMKTYDRFNSQEQKSLYLFDSFRGLPAAASEVDRVSPHVASGVWGEGTCLGITEEELVRKCEAHLERGRIRTFAGWFAETLPLLPAETRFALLHIDCDLYQSTKDVLDQCFGRGLVSAGAAIFFDDWNCNAARPDLGERRAWAEAVAQYRIEASDCGEYGMGCRKFVVHGYTPAASTPVRAAGAARQLTVAGRTPVASPTRSAPWTKLNSPPCSAPSGTLRP